MQHTTIDPHRFRIIFATIVALATVSAYMALVLI